MIKDWNPKDWYKGKFNCKPYQGVRYEEDIDFWCSASPVALMEHIERFSINVPTEKWKKICRAVRIEEHGI